ncbi:3-oxoacyl-[acyl-carrier protein] reductase [Jatrophihabitans endophyticus]|uniref:3-oxoacyl-[acyl-carrier protein] reductase n=1 Tax=Jatrophihabitans endophyticus TaxID=1206085 RepID=A0A1M5HTJ9_9ACTN|nr:3-oxoacyl-ACP reductase [Jatrophihabitans endophyticus]SHG19291.1 3-oxoacyl-[acyl-carrier protein] reductase [Jatrophihabitans endophyticus]
MSDRYLNLVNSPVGSAVAARVGLPQPSVLRRYEAGAPILPGPVLLGSTSPKPAAGLRKAVEATGAEVLDLAGEGVKVAAAVLDARSVSAPGDLARLREFLQPATKALAANGRVLVLGTPADGADITADATRQALDGIVRSLAKELRRGATANLLWVQDEASLPAALRFFLSGRSAYVDGQPVLLGAGTAPAPADWTQPLAGKTALVTGAARGIGAAIAGVLARDGAKVICADLTQAGEALAKVANRVGGTALHLDVAAPEASATLLEHLAAQTAGLDVLVHNAGITRDKLMANMKPEQWDSVIAVNLQSQLSINAALLDSDQLNQQARVVCLSSTTGLSGNRGQTNYGATKSGVIGLVRASAAAFAAHGDSTINAVAPGFIDTEMTAKMPFATREVARRLSSLQQAGLPVDVAEGVAWLASPGAGGVNGQVLRVCGQNLVGA